MRIKTEIYFRILSWRSLAVLLLGRMRRAAKLSAGKVHFNPKDAKQKFNKTPLE